MKDLLFGVTPTDLPTLLAVAAALFIVAAAGCFVPAYRASTVDAIVALRHE